jgi:hypothetical protein
MGLLKALVLAPFAPVSGVLWIAGVLADEAERVQATQQSPELALAELAAKRANGEISDEDADALEDRLMEEMLSRHVPTEGV